MHTIALQTRVKGFELWGHIPGFLALHYSTSHCTNFHGVFQENISEPFCHLAGNGVHWTTYCSTLRPAGIGRGGNTWSLPSECRVGGIDARGECKLWFPHSKGSYNGHLPTLYIPQFRLILHMQWQAPYITSSRTIIMGNQVLNLLRWCSFIWHFI